MNVIEAIILGLVQGLTEFLPVSSSGHLVLLQGIFGIEGDVVLFDVLLHFATLLAVVLYFFKDIINLFKPPYKNMVYLIISVIPAVVVMLLFKDYIDIFFGGTYLCFGFLITATLLFLTEYIDKNTIQNNKTTSQNNSGITVKRSLIMGIAQSVAVIPAISRSGSTICAGILSGADKKSVAKFSFLMSLPIIAGSALVSMFDIGNATIDILPLLAGMVSAFITALIAIKIMLKIIEKSNYKWFSLYLIILAVITFIDAFVVNIW